MLCIYWYHIYTPLLNGYNLSFHLFSKGCPRCPTWIFLEARPHQPRGVLDVPTWIAGSLQLTSHSKKDTKRPQRSQRSLSWRCQWCQWLFLLNFPSEWVSKKVHRRHPELFLGYGWPRWINFKPRRTGKSVTWDSHSTWENLAVHPSLSSSAPVVDHDCPT